MQALLALVGVVAAGALIKSGIRWFFRERPKRSAAGEPTIKTPTIKTPTIKTPTIKTKGRNKTGK